MIKTLVGLILLFCIFCIIVIFYVKRIERNTLFLPSKEISVTPANEGLKYEDIYFSTPEGETINAWFIEVSKTSPVMLVCHGNAGNIGDRVELLSLIHI